LSHYATSGTRLEGPQIHIDFVLGPFFAGQCGPGFAVVRRPGPAERLVPVRRSLTEEEQHKIAEAIVDHLESHNWKIEHGP
jgi:hypothetical protein